MTIGLDRQRVLDGRRAAEAYATRATARAIVIKRAGVAALLGGAGLGLALFGASYLLELPRINYRDIEVPRLTFRDVTPDHVIPRDVPINNPVPHDVEVAIPRIVVVTEAEKRFIDSKAYADATIHGRIVPSRSDRMLSFDDGNDYTPTLPAMAADAARFVGLWGYCAPIGATDRFYCYALMPDGRVASVPQIPIKQGRPT